MYRDDHSAGLGHTSACLGYALTEIAGDDAVPDGISDGTVDRVEWWLEIGEDYYRPSGENLKM